MNTGKFRSPFTTPKVEDLPDLELDEVSLAEFIKVEQKTKLNTGIMMEARRQYFYQTLEDEFGMKILSNSTAMVAS